MRSLALLLVLGCDAPLGLASLDGRADPPDDAGPVADANAMDTRDATPPDAPAGDASQDAPLANDATVDATGFSDASAPADASVAPDLAHDAGADSGDAPIDATPDSGADATAVGADAGVGECAAAQLGARLGKSRFLIGGDMDDTSFSQATLDWRANYIANDVPEIGPCTSCAIGCSVNGQSCANNGCDWWGCWQSDAQPPGRFAVDFIHEAQDAGAIPWLTYYVWHYVAAESEGWLEIAALSDPGRLRPYLLDWRFFCERVAEATSNAVMIHVEPDLWGFGEQVDEDPEAIPAAVSAAMAPECAGEPNTFGGLARCMLAIARAEAPNALVGFHASAWGAGANAIQNDDPGFDLLAHAQTTAAFMTALGAGAGDFIAVEMSDRDAGEDGNWWDASDGVLPHFAQARDWARETAAGLDLAPVWWQVPYGSAALPNSCTMYRDNRLDYIFDWPERFATDALGVLFGGGASCSTEPLTDGGHFLTRADEYFSQPRPVWCQ